MDYLLTQGFSSCYLWTTNEPEIAAFLYRKHGFVLNQEKKSLEIGKQLIEQKYIFQ